MGVQSLDENLEEYSKDVRNYCAPTTDLAQRMIIGMKTWSLMNKKKFKRVGSESEYILGIS